jgi:pre-mRNA-splicing helicase BRR2
VYVPSRKQAQLTAIDLATYAAAAGDPLLFLGGATSDAKAAVAAQLAEVLAAAGQVTDPALASTLPKGVAFVHGGMPAAERRRCEALAADGVARVLVVPYGLAWQVACRASLVIVMDTVSYDGRDHR